MKKILATIVLTLLLISLFQTILPVKAQAKVLKIGSPHNEFIRTEFANAFKAWYQQKYGETVEVEWPDLGGTSAIVKYIESHVPNASIGIDMMFGGGVDPFIKLTGEGYLEPYKLPDSELSAIPQSLAGIPMYDSNYAWYGAALSGFGIMYNKPVLQQLGLPEPKTWEDLTSAQAVGWISSADPRNSGSTHMAYEIMLQGYGWDKGWQIITEIGANTKAFPKDSGAVPGVVSNGETAYGLVIDFYAWAEIAKNGADKIGYVMPEGLTVINPDSIAIIKGAPNMEVAQRFEEFVLSEQGQSLWMLPAGASGGPVKNTLGRMGVLPSLYTKLGTSSIVPVNPFELKSTLNYDPVTGSAHFAVLNDMIGSMIIDQHDALLGAWTKINDAKNVQGMTEASLAAAIEALGKAPITQAQADEYGKQWSDQVFRNQQITAWRDFATSKYNDASTASDKAVADLQAAQAAEAAAAAQQQQMMMYAGVGVAVIVIIAVAAYLLMKRRKETAAVKK